MMMREAERVPGVMAAGAAVGRPLSMALPRVLGRCRLEYEAMKIYNYEVV